MLDKNLKETRAVKRSDTTRKLYIMPPSVTEYNEAQKPIPSPSVFQTNTHTHTQNRN